MACHLQMSAGIKNSCPEVTPLPVLASAMLVTQVSISESAASRQGGSTVSPEVKLSNCARVMPDNESSLSIGQDSM